MNVALATPPDAFSCLLGARLLSSPETSTSELGAALAMLPLPEQVILSLLYVEELSLPEVAWVLDLSEQDAHLLVSAAATLLLRALQTPS